MYTERRKQIPKLLKDRETTHECVSNYDLNSNRGEEMIQVNSVDSGIIIFTTRTYLELLCDRNVDIFSDGTFKTCPKHFYQMYSLHAYKNGQYVPCVFALLPSKTRNVYKQMFKHIKNLCEDHGFDLHPNQIHMDFEVGAHEGIRDVWLNIAIRGCHFHLSQAWYRKIASLGLTSICLRCIVAFIRCALCSIGCARFVALDVRAL